MLAASQRLDNFEQRLRANFEGFPLPDLVDKIIIASGPAVAVKDGSREAANLMLRGGEVLARNLRHQLVDVAVLLSTQQDSKARRDAHSYIHLVGKKREWKIQMWLSRDPKLPDRSKLISELGRSSGCVGI